MATQKRNKLQYLASFLFDSLIESRHSVHNPVLTVKYYEGGYLLDSASANYSFGTLHHAFRQIFDRIGIQNKPVQSALILGYGAGSVAELIRERLGNIPITGVEIDHEVIDLAGKYFKLDEQVNLSLKEMDAARYAESCQDRFDLVAVDLFINDRVPDQFHTESFLLNLKALLNPDGTLVFNSCIMGAKQDVRPFSKLFSTVFTGGRQVPIGGNTFQVWEGGGVTSP